MKLIFFLSLFYLLFSSYYFYSKDINKVDIDKFYTLNIPSVKSGSPFRFVEIFSPFEFLNISYSKGNLDFVLQASFIVRSTETENVHLSSKQKSTFWYRIINNLRMVPSSYLNYINLNLAVKKENDSYTSITFNRTISPYGYISDFIYELWVVPIFPAGEYRSWGADLSSVNQDMIMSAINDSIYPSRLKEMGKLIATGVDISSFSLVNRKTYTHLILIQTTSNSEIVLQYPPTIIYGCTFMNVFSSSDKGYSSIRQTQDSFCTLISDSRTWYIIIMTISVCGILFVLFAHYWEIIQFFCSGSFFMAFVSVIVIRSFFKYVFESDLYLFIIIIGCPSAFFLCLSLILAKCSKKGNRIRIIFNVLLVIVIQWSILWFALVPFVSKIILLSINGVVSVVLFIVLIIYNEITITVGSTFIGMAIVCFGFSTSLITASGIPYLLLDFYYFLIYGKMDVYYFSYFLLNDLIVQCIWVFIIVVFGTLAYSEMQRRKRRTVVEPPIILNDFHAEINRITYGTFRRQPHVNIVNVVTTVNEQLYSPPTYSAEPTAPMVRDKPPSYHEFYN